MLRVYKLPKVMKIIKKEKIYKKKYKIQKLWNKYTTKTTS